MTKIRYGSVCSGVEAASLAWIPLGWEAAFYAEVEPFPAAVLMQRFNATKPLRPLDPEEAADEKDRALRTQWLNQINKLPDGGTIPNLGDFTKITKDDFNGNIDLLVGGTPCQDLSVAGKRAGFGNRKDEECATTRSSLAIDFVRLAYQLGCEWFVWENVPGVFSSNDGRDFATLLSLFAGREVGVPEQGFGTSGFVCPTRRDRFGMAWRVLDAQFTRTPGFPYAVPQRRRRCFLVGRIGDWTGPAAVLLEPGRMSWNPPTRVKTRQGAAANPGSGVDSASAIRMRAGCEGGGKGALIGNDLSHTLQCGNDQTIVEFADDVSNTLEACYYKGVAGTYKERTIVSVKPQDEKLVLSANGTSFGGRTIEEISGPITTHESGIRGDTKIILSLASGQGGELGCLGVNVSQTLTRNNGGLSYIASYEDNDVH